MAKKATKTVKASSPTKEKPVADTSVTAHPVAAKSGNKTLIIILVILGLLLLCCIGSVVVGGILSSTIVNQAENIKKEVKENVEESDHSGAKTKQDCYDEAYDKYIEQWNDKCSEIGEGDDCQLLEDESSTIDAEYNLQKVTCDLIYPDGSQN